MNKRLFAIGDIHGCFESLTGLVKNKIQLQKSDKLILLGDYIDRGDKSKEVIDFIIELLEKGYDIVPLLGNHEAMLIDASENEQNTSKWIQNGGQYTLESFQINDIQMLPQKYLDFFLSLKHFHSYHHFLFVHAGFNDSIQNPFSEQYSMLWNCQKEYTHPLLKDKIIIHGHRPISLDACKNMIQKNGKTINLDTGCVYADKEGYGTLTAYDCNANALHFV